MHGWNVFLVWLFGAGVAQGLFLVAALFALNVRNATARNLLIVIVFATTLMLGGEFFELLDIPVQPGIGLAVEFPWLEQPGP